MESSVVDYVPDIQHVQAGMGSSVVDYSDISNVRALGQQLTQHMCISTTLTTQLAMQLQQAMLTRQQITTSSRILMLMVLSRVILVLTVSYVPCIRSILFLF
jgi:hypothetical protein